MIQTGLRKLRRPSFRALAAFACLLLPPAALAQVDEWVPHTDGRIGGCYRAPTGQLYNCTRPPEPTPEDVAAQEAADTRAELAEVRRELEALKKRQAEEDAARERAQRDLDAQAQAAADAEQRDIDLAMEAWGAIEAAKEGERLRELAEQTEACRARLEARGYRVVGPGACRAPDDTYVNCPPC